MARVEHYRMQKLELEEAVELAVDDCIKAGVLADILSKFRNEVCNMFLTEYDEELHMKNTYAEGRDEGRKEGRREGRQEGMAESVIELLEMSGTIPANLRQQILEMDDIATLKKWIKIAATTNSIEEFRKNI